LVVLGFAVLAEHVRHGGFYVDDWSIAAAYHFDGWERTSVDEWRHVIPGRPILALLHPLPYALFGLNPSYQLSTAAVLAMLASLSFFAFLRACGFELRHALAMALLSLVFPWNDATRLWPTGAMNNVAVIAYFVGSVAALRALALWDADRRRAVALHAGAAVLYVASTLTYQVAGAAMLLSGLLYRARVPWRALRARWLGDVALTVVVLAVSLYFTSRVRDTASLSDRAADLPHFIGQSLTIFASVLVPPRVSSPWAASWEITSPSAGKLVVLAAAFAVVFVAAVRCKRRAEPELRTWLYRAAGGACGVAAAYVMFLGSGLVPLFYPGVDDRTNTLAAFGFVVASYSLVVLAALLIGSGRRAVTAVVVTTATFVIGVGFIQRVREDVRRYDAATVEQRHFLKRLKIALPRPPHGLTIFTFGSRAEVAPGVPIFQYTWDLEAAISLRWNDRSLKGVPIYGQGVSCSGSGVRPLAFGGEPVAAYGRAVFVDVPTQRTQLIGSRRACAWARTSFEPGPSCQSASGGQTEDCTKIVIRGTAGRTPPGNPVQQRRNVREEQAARDEHKSAQSIDR